MKENTGDKSEVGTVIDFIVSFMKGEPASHIRNT